MAVRDRDLFVDSSQTTIAAPTLGHTAFTCHECHAEWTPGQENCSRCHGVVFDSTYVEPTLLERIGNRIMGVGTPEKVTVRPLDADDVAVFERLAAAGRAYAVALQDADERARVIVNSDRSSGSMAYLQGKLNAVALMAGDASPSSMVSSQALPAIALAHLVDDMVAQHATEVNA